MTLIITDADVERLLSMEECIEAMHTAFKDFSNGDAVNRPRVRYLARHSDPKLRYMANVHVGACPSVGIACVRAGSSLLRPASPENQRRSYETPSGFNWGVVVLYSTETAEPLALMHEFYLSGLRVGATTGAAVRELTPKGASTLGLFGTGKQARNAFEAICAVRPITKAKIYSPNEEHKQAFAAEMARQGIEVIAAKNAEEVVRGSDVVCAATNAMSAVFDGDWLTDGQIVVTTSNSDVTNKRSEADPKTFARARQVIVNDWESVIDSDQTELLDPIEKGILSREQVLELGDVMAGKAKVQHDGEGILFFKNNSGLAIQFAAAAGIIIPKAIEEGKCKSIPTEWLGSDLNGYIEKGFRPSP
ncbi:MAG: hypothetical protein RLZ98_2221 [Pseudomonadota bacterium]|jgi:ornithine cyclodeaminase/alanine dehydrogenase-like protein (mu-crystallin family)